MKMPCLPPGSDVSHMEFRPCGGPVSLSPKTTESHPTPTTPPIRFALVIAILLVAPMGPVHAQGADADAAAVVSAVRDFHVALEAGDSQVVSRLLAPDAAILEGGERETRKEYIDHHLPADIKFAQAVTTHYSKTDVTVSGEVAWATSTSVTRGTYESKPVNLVGAELMILSKSPAGWVIRSIHWSSRNSK
jgi:ketosteroid isomerase-like protein